MDNNNVIDTIEDPISDESDRGGLVPYGFHSDTESDYEYPKKSNKRKKGNKLKK